MSCRNLVLALLIGCTLVVPIVQLGFGFHYVNSPSSCTLYPDIMLLMAIGGVFQAIFYAACFGFLYNITPSKYKKTKVKSVAQASAKGSNRASKILIGTLTNVIFSTENEIFTEHVFFLGLITAIFGACAMTFFVLIQFRVYPNMNRVNYNNLNSTTYCSFTVFTSAFGLSIATYVALLFIVIVAFILLCGIGAHKQQ